MTHTAPPSLKLFVLTAGAALALSLSAQAGQRPEGPAAERGASFQRETRGAVPLPLVDEGSAQQTRDRLNDLLEKYPPALGRVLKLDPSLLSSPTYLAPYPLLAAFLAQHSEVAHNPAYFLENVSSPDAFYNDPKRREREEMLGVLAGLGVFIAFLIVVGVMVWLIRLIVANRRWNRLSKVQFDVHTKLLDRFTSNEELLAYVQTPAGRRFLESAPIPLQDEPRSIAAPLSRILWSVQAGIILMVAGFGLLQVSRRFVEEPAQFFMVLGILALALGAGFVVSAIAAYGLSRKLGLLDPPAADHA
jgi:hypothetical protein